MFRAAGTKFLALNAFVSGTHCRHSVP